MDRNCRSRSHMSLRLVTLRGRVFNLCVYSNRTWNRKARSVWMLMAIETSLWDQIWRRSILHITLRTYKRPGCGHLVLLALKSLDAIHSDCNKNAPLIINGLKTTPLSLMCLHCGSERRVDSAYGRKGRLDICLTMAKLSLEAASEPPLTMTPALHGRNTHSPSSFQMQALNTMLDGQNRTAQTEAARLAQVWSFLSIQVVAPTSIKHVCSKYLRQATNMYSQPCFQ